MSAGVRKLALTAHVTASVGWLGAVAAFLAIAAVALTSDDPATVRGAYLVLEPAAWFVLLPLAVASLVTGLVQSLVSPYGLVRHYWVLFKLFINVFATVLLVLYLGTLAELAELAAADAPIARLDTVSVALHSAAALVLLGVATVLAVYKPRGVTPFGRARG